MQESDRLSQPFSTKRDWPYYWISRVNARYALQLESLLKPHGLDISRWRVLASLQEHGSLGVSEISEYAILRLNNTTKIVQKMAVDGLVRTRSRSADARVTEVSLTEDGERQATLARELAQKLFERSFRDVDAKELRMLNELLKKVFDRLGEGDAQG